MRLHDKDLKLDCCVKGVCCVLILGAVSDEICRTYIDPGSPDGWRATSLILRRDLPLAEILLLMPHLSQSFIQLLFSVSGGGTKAKAEFFFIYDAFPKKTLLAPLFLIKRRQIWDIFMGTRKR